MPAMIRKQIYLDKATDDLLKRESKTRRISQAALIRKRLNRDAPATDVAIPNPKVREEFLAYLRQVSHAAAPGPGTGRKIDRDELYAERRKKARSTRH